MHARRNNRFRPGLSRIAAPLPARARATSRRAARLRPPIRHRRKTGEKSIMTPSSHHARDRRQAREERIDQNREHQRVFRPR